MKINFTRYTRHAGHIVAANSPTILTGLGVLGVVATGYLTAKASFVASNKIKEAQPFDFNVPGEKSPEPLNVKQKSLLVWKLYIPAVASGALTIGCVVAANRIQARRMAALAAAYAVLSGDFDEYKEKAREALGLKKSSELDQKRAQKAIDSAPAPAGGILLSEGKSWFLDKTTKRYLVTTRETILGVQNEMNFTIINHGDVSLNDFYAQLGMEPVQIGDLLGWNRSHPVKVDFAPILTEDRGAVTAFEFLKGPLPEFWKLKERVDPEELN